MENQSTQPLHTSDFKVLRGIESLLNYYVCIFSA